MVLDNSEFLIALSRNFFILIFDLSTQQPKLISRTLLSPKSLTMGNLAIKINPHSIHNFKCIAIQLIGSTLFCAGENIPISIIHIANPAKPVLIAQTNHSFQVSGLDSNFDLFKSRSICGVSLKHTYILKKENRKMKLLLISLQPNQHIRSVSCLNKYAKTICGDRTGNLTSVNFRAMKRVRITPNSGHNEIIYVIKKIHNEKYVVVADHQGTVSVWEAFREVKVLHLQCMYMPRAVVRAEPNQLIVGLWYNNQLDVLTGLNEKKWEQNGREEWKKSKRAEKRIKENGNKKEGTEKGNTKGFFSKIKKFFS